MAFLHNNEVWVKRGIQLLWSYHSYSLKVLAIFSNFVRVLTSSSQLLVCIIVFKWFEFPRSSSSTIVKTSLGPNFMAWQ